MKTGTSVDLSVDLAGLRLATPFMTASGTSGYGPEYAPLADISSFGAFVTKAVTVKPRRGNPPPRTCETASGMLNAIGLANLGLDEFLENKVSSIRTLGTPVIVNVAGHSEEDYVTVCRALDQVDAIAGLELNVSCPNVSDGLEFGTNPDRLRALVETVRPNVCRAKLIVKLSPNVTDICSSARAAIAGGADILSAINTPRGMAINIETRRPVLANRYGGLSGPAVKPIAICMIHQIYTKVAAEAGVPIIGMGGAETWKDAVEFHLAGATGIAVGTALFVNPDTPNLMAKGLAEYLERKGMRSVNELIGALEV